MERGRYRNIQADAEAPERLDINATTLLEDRYSTDDLAARAQAPSKPGVVPTHRLERDISAAK